MGWFKRTPQPTLPENYFDLPLLEQSTLLKQLILTAPENRALKGLARNLGMTTEQMRQGVVARHAEILDEHVEQTRLQHQQQLTTQHVAGSQTFAQLFR